MLGEVLDGTLVLRVPRRTYLRSDADQPLVPMVKHSNVNDIPPPKQMPIEAVATFSVFGLGYMIMVGATL